MKRQRENEQTKTNKMRIVDFSNKLESYTIFCNQKMASFDERLKRLNCEYRRDINKINNNYRILFSDIHKEMKEFTTINTRLQHQAKRIIENDKTRKLFKEFDMIKFIEIISHYMYCDWRDFYNFSLVSKDWNYSMKKFTKYLNVSDKTLPILNELKLSHIKFKVNENTCNVLSSLGSNGKMTINFSNKKVTDINFIGKIHNKVKILEVIQGCISYEILLELFQLKIEKLILLNCSIEKNKTQKFHIDIKKYNFSPTYIKTLCLINTKWNLTQVKICLRSMIFDNVYICNNINNFYSNIKFNMNKEFCKLVDGTRVKKNFVLFDSFNDNVIFNYLHSSIDNEFDEQYQIIIGILKSLLYEDEEYSIYKSITDQINRIKSFYHERKKGYENMKNFYLK